MKKSNENPSLSRATLFRCLLFGIGTGVASGVIITLYKLLAKGAVSLSRGLFTFLRTLPVFLPLALVFFFFLARFLHRLYEKEPDLMGGGIPDAVGTCRGIFSFVWWKIALGNIFLSLLSFTLGVPLGTEGPSVQIGTSLGKGLSSRFGKENEDEKIFATCGATSGFAVATGAPIAAMLFFLEEIHKTFSLPLLVSTFTSVLSASLTSLVLSPLFGVDAALFKVENLATLSLKEWGLPLVLGLALGLFAFLFLRFYSLLWDLLSNKGKKVRRGVKIFAVLTLTLILGLVSSEFVSTGHHFILSLLEESPSLFMLLFVVIFRCILTLSANISGMTGGTFLPILAIGAGFSATLGKALVLYGMKEEFFSLFVCLGICGCIAGMMKMPLTALFFGLEGLGLGENFVPLVVVCALSFAIPHLLKEESIGEKVLERKINAKKEV